MEVCKRIQCISKGKQSNQLNKENGFQLIDSQSKLSHGGRIRHWSTDESFMPVSSSSLEPDPPSCKYLERLWWKFNDARLFWRWYWKFYAIYRRRLQPVGNQLSIGRQAADRLQQGCKIPKPVLVKPFSDCWCMVATNQRLICDQNQSQLVLPTPGDLYETLPRLLQPICNCFCVFFSQGKGVFCLNVIFGLFMLKLRMPRICISTGDIDEARL